MTLRGPLLLAVILLVAACAAPPEPPADPLPTLDEIAPRVHGPRAPVGSQPEVMVRVFRIAVPADWPMADAWDLTDDTALSATALRRWQANGLRAGLLDPRRLDALAETLPRGATSAPVTLMVGRAPVPVATTGRVTLPPDKPLTWRLVGDEREQPMTAEGGRFRFLLEALAGRVVEVIVTPQHHEPRLTLEPREPAEKVLDGRVFDPLSLAATLPAGRLLVIGMAEGPTDKETPLPTDETPTASGPEEEAAPRLGDLLLSGSRHGRGIQLLLVIGARPLTPGSW